MSPIEQIKEKLKITDLIAESFTVTGRGRIRTTTEHDSLKIYTDTNTWYWYSQASGGDLLDWWQHIHRTDFATALESLAAKAGVELRQLTQNERNAITAQRKATSERNSVLAIAATYYHEQLLATEPGRTYCASRGWDYDTLIREHLGYSPVSTDKPLLSVGEDKPLATRLRDAGLLDHPLAQAVLSVPQGMIIYAHRHQGQVVYLSARSIHGKRHWNLPADLAGERQPYHTNLANAKRGAMVLVEGQADAISLAQLGIDAVALCGLATSDATLPDISHVALDNDAAGQAKALDLALSISPLTRVITWPSQLRHKENGKNHVQIKDANDLLHSEANLETLSTLMDAAPPAIAMLAAKAGKAKDEERKQLIQRFFSVYESLDEMDQTDLKPELAAKLCNGVSQFQRLWKAHQKQNEEEKPSPAHYEYSAGGARLAEKNSVVWEQCVVAGEDGISRSIFAIRKHDGTITTNSTVDVGDTAYIPYPPNMGLIGAGVVLFPEKPEEYGGEKQLVDEIKAFIHKYLDVDRFYENLAAYYVLFTWMYDVFENLPYLRALGDYGTGKTRFITVIGACCYRPMFASGASTVSPIFNMIDMFRGTLIIDEADFQDSSESAEIIKILNVGYYKKGVVLRSEKDQSNGNESDKYWPSAKLVYGPKILATRKPFGDRATESRCLTRRMSTNRPRPGIPYTLEDDFWQEATKLRNKLLMYRLRNYRALRIDQSLADESVEPRLNQVTMAIKTIIDDTEMRQQIDTFIRAYNETMISDRQMTLPALVVSALADIHWTNGTNVLGEDIRDFTMKGIANKVQEMINEIDPDTKVNPKLISKTLTEDLGLPQRKPHPETRRAMLVYAEEELHALMQRYGVDRPV